MRGFFDCGPANLNLPKERPVRLIGVAVIVSAVSVDDQKPKRLQFFWGTNNSPPVNAQQMRNTVKARVASAGFSIERVDDGSGNSPLCGVQAFMVRNSFKGQRDIKPRGKHGSPRQNLPSRNRQPAETLHSNDMV